MAASRPTDEHAPLIDDAPHPRRSRRGVIAGAAALVAGVLAARSAQPVGAAQLVGTNGYGGTLDTNADGVQGYAVGANAGVFGRNNDLNGVGVLGAAPSGIGVSGASTNGPGLSGTSTNGFGLYAGSINSHGAVGVSAKAGYGAVWGTTNNVPGAWGGIFNGAVAVGATDNHAIQANSTLYNGVVGSSSAPGFAGVSGQATGTNGYGIIGAAYSPAVYAGYFAGSVYVTGNFTVAGAKNAAVPHPDGTHRLYYSIEAPESWFEDVGQANLVAGKATVALDPDFAATVLTANYHVFLTPYGDCKGLAVTSRTAAGFVVQEGQGGASSLAFSWRVMAKRKDIAGPRLATIEPPPPPPVVQPPAIAAVPGMESPPPFPQITGAPAGPAAGQPAAPASPAALPASTPAATSAPAAPTAPAPTAGPPTVAPATPTTAATTPPTSVPTLAPPAAPTATAPPTGTPAPAAPTATGTAPSPIAAPRP